MSTEIQNILDYLHTARSFDFSTSRYSTLERKIANRLSELGLNRADEYIQYLEADKEEWNTLIDLLTINVSQFFRNPLTFEIFSNLILPNLILKKSKESFPSLRIWSAGCASGEEAYSIAILISEFLQKETMELDANIFATDINHSILKKARKGQFVQEQLGNVKLKILKRYFTKDSGLYLLDEKIREMVSFLYYDIIDSKTYVPPESVFGNFDLVLCRNLLIYFQKDRQALIFNKLFRSLAPHGYLILGEAERLPQEYQYQFTKDTEYCHIYRKIN